MYSFYSETECRETEKKIQLPVSSEEKPTPKDPATLSAPAVSDAATSLDAAPQISLLAGSRPYLRQRKPPLRSTGLAFLLSISEPVVGPEVLVQPFRVFFPD